MVRVCLIHAISVIGGNPRDSVRFTNVNAIALAVIDVLGAVNSAGLEVGG